MSYAILRTAKLKTMGNIAASAEHQFRERYTHNADPSRTPANQVVGAASAQDMLDLVKKCLDGLSVRKNAVLVIEMLITASPDFFSKRKGGQYFKDAFHWARGKFGRDNIVSAVLHHDETTPHLAIFIVPIDDKGRLNCRHYLGGREKLSAMQTDFATQVGEKYGLERGIKGSIAEHTTIKEYYSTATTPAASVPDIQPLSRKDHAAAAAGIATAALQAHTEAQAALIETAHQNAVQNRELKRQLNDTKASLKTLTTVIDNEQRKLALSRMRDIPLPEVLTALGCERDPADKNNWKTEQGRLTINGLKFFFHDLGRGGGGSLDLVMGLRSCKFYDALAELSSLFGLESVTSAAVVQIARLVEQVKPTPSAVPSNVPSNWPVLKNWMVQSRQIPDSILEAAHEQGVLQVDARGNALFINSDKNGCEVRGRGMHFKGYRGSRGVFEFKIDDSKEVLIVESGTDALAAAALGRFRGLVVSTCGDWSNKTLDAIKIRFKDYQIKIGTDADESGDQNAARLSKDLPNAIRERPQHGRDWQADLRESLSEEASHIQTQDEESAHIDPSYQIPETQPCPVLLSP